MEIKAAERLVTRGVWTVLLCSVLAVSAVSMEIGTLKEAVDVSGKQRMYAMRMLKDYVLIGLKLEVGTPGKDLRESMTAYSTALKALKRYVKDPAAEKILTGIDKQWNTLQITLNQMPRRQEAPQYREAFLELRSRANELTNLLAKSADGGTGEAINVSGRLRMISQALAAGYLLKTWGDGGADKFLNHTMKRFRESLDYLSRAGATGEEMRPILKRMERTYLYFSVMNDSTDTFTPTLVVKKTDRMLRDAIRLVRMYVDGTKS